MYWSISLCTHCMHVLVNLTVHTLHTSTGQSHCAHTAYKYWSISLCTHCIQVLVNLTVHTLHTSTGQSHCAHTEYKYWSISLCMHVQINLKVCVNLVRGQVLRFHHPFYGLTIQPFSKNHLLQLLRAHACMRVVLVLLLYITIYHFKGMHTPVLC